MKPGELICDIARFPFAKIACASLDVEDLAHIHLLNSALTINDTDYWALH